MKDSTGSVMTIVIHDDDYRVQEVEVIAGERNTVCHTSESGVKISVDLSRMFFSSRLASERMLVAKHVQQLLTERSRTRLPVNGDDRESFILSHANSLFLFSGCGIFGLVTAKIVPCSMVVMVEANPDAHSLAVDNISKNKMENYVLALHGDVQSVCPRLCTYRHDGDDV